MEKTTHLPDHRTWQAFARAAIRNFQPRWSLHRQDPRTWSDHADTQAHKRWIADAHDALMEACHESVAVDARNLAFLAQIKCADTFTYQVRKITASNMALIRKAQHAREYLAGAQENDQ